MPERGNHLRRGWFAGAFVLLLAVMAWCMYSSARSESVAWDEWGHVPHGYDYLVNGNYWFDQVHAAGPRLLAALPLLLVKPRIPTEHESYRAYDLFRFRNLFWFHNRTPADTILMLARLPVMVFTLIVAAVLALWTRAQFGDGAGITAAAMFCFEPLLLAFGHYATTDLFSTGFAFFAILVWAAYLNTRRLAHLLLAALLVGASLLMKHSMVFLFGVFPILYLIRRWQQPGRLTVLRLVVGMLVIGMVAVCMVGLVYWPVTRVAMDGGAPPMADQIDTSTPVGERFHRVAEAFNLPLHPYVMGLYWLAKTNEGGLPGYLLGETYMGGRWLFFPVAFAVKNSTAFLTALLLAAGAAVGAVARRDGEHHPRRLPFAWYVLVVPPLLYLPPCLASNINAGVRHLLPVYPFLFAFTAAVLWRTLGTAWVRRLRVVVVLLLGIGLAAESVAAHPHYLGFFNLPSGGPAAGYRYLGLSNIDWGQDLKQLDRYLEREGIDEICLAFFGTGDPNYYGIRSRYLPTTEDLAAGMEADCVAAISVNYLVGLHPRGPGAYAWLREREPDARIGNSIHIYDLRGQQVPAGGEDGLR